MSTSVPLSSAAKTDPLSFVTDPLSIPLALLRDTHAARHGELERGQHVPKDVKATKVARMETVDG